MGTCGWERHEVGWLGGCALSGRPSFIRRSRAVKFIDSFDHTMDGKGRVVLPSKYRDDFRGGAFLVSKGRYLAVYTPDDWKAYCDLLEERCLAGQVDRAWVGEVYAWTSEVLPDAQGRIVVNPVLREAVSLATALRIKGHGNHLGIYARDDAPAEPGLPSMTDMAAHLSKMGL